jgi:Domain of unknown function (DUF6777)/TIR domain
MTTDAPGVFISYRRKESSHLAGRLYDRLIERLGEARVFMDVDSIKPGEDWTEAISRAVAKCGLMLVLIGSQWGQVHRRSHARIVDSDDPVRLEIEAAFNQRIPIIPVLLEDATMPRPADLPETLMKLSHLQAMRVRHESFRSDAATLLTVVEEVLGTYGKEDGPHRAHLLVNNILAPDEKKEVADPSSLAREVQPDSAIASPRTGKGPDPPPREVRRVGLGRRLLVPLLSLISLLAVGFATWIFLTTSRDQASGAEIAEPIDTAVNPFLPAAGQDATETPPAEARGTVRGDTPGLFGGTRRGTSCDAARLVDFLQAHADKGAAWAHVLDMPAAEIPSFVAQLTPVVLRADTRVTNHGFVNGHATTFSSILQAGTAVLVDRQGLPVVKCFCGNPLTPPRPNLPQTYQGKAWSGFDAQKVVVIKPAPSAVKSFTVVDPTTGKPARKKTGVNVRSSNQVQPDQNGPVGPNTTTSESASHSSSVTPSTADAASPTPSITPSSADATSPTPYETPTTEDPKIGQKSVSPTESATTNRPNDDGSPGQEESSKTGEGTDSIKEEGSSQETSKKEPTEGSGSGKTQTGTDNTGETGTNGDTGTNEDAGGGATSSPGAK